MTVMTQASGGGGRSGSLYDVIELILDRGLVIDAFVRVSLLGIEVLTVEARVVVASVDTYLRFAETARAGRSDRRERHEERVEAGPGPEGGFEVSTYVYAFTGASHPLPVDSLAGVGEGKPPLRLVRHDGLTAVVSDAPERLRAKRRDVEAHERVLETLFAAGTVLPMRFGTVAADDESVKAELASRAKRYTKLLSRLKGKVEVNVKAVHREESVLRELLLGSQELRTRSEALRASGGGSHQDKVALGERLSVALEDRRSQDAEQVVAELRPHASAVKLGPPVDGCFVNVSFLVGATDRKDFEAALSRLRRERAELMEIRLYGPLPPYSFLASGEAGD